MNRHAVKPAKRLSRTIDAGAVKVNRPAAAPNPFVSFHYSCSEISAQGGRARLKFRQARFEDGRLSAESFDGELDGSAYGQMMAGAKRYFAALFAESLALVLPSSGPRDPDCD
ncbi:MAG: hypothetical protein ACREYB_06885 [Casimicrobiaceae bacterium]